MIVKKKKGNADHTLDDNNAYVVISILINAHMEKDTVTAYSMSYRVINLWNVPALYPADIFEVLDGTIDNSWIVRPVRSSFEIAPSLINYPMFWENFFDDDKDAIAKFLESFPGANIVK